MFWAQRSGSFPILHTVSAALLSVPATNASSERALSMANTIISAKKSNIKSENVNKIMVLNSHFKIEPTMNILNLLPEE